MKKNSLLALSLIIVFTMMLVTPAWAAKPYKFRANGTVDNYLGYDPNNPGSAMVVGGNWNINVRDEFNVDFKLFYREMNLISEDEGGAPVGSVDQFRISLVELYIVRYGPGVGCIIIGRFNVDKLAWLAEGSTPRIDKKYNFVGDVEGSVWVTSAGLELYIGPWNLVGSTTSMTK